MSDAGKKRVDDNYRERCREFSKLSKGSKGHTKENNPNLARNAKLNSLRLKGKKIPQFTQHREFMKTPEYRKQLSERMKKYYAENPHKHINFRLAQKGYETSIERKIRIALEKNRIPFEKQFHIDKYWADFAIIEANLVIEADGKYWHKNKEKDKKRDSVIESLGWKVIRFTEQEINKNIDLCLKTIKSFI